MPKSRFYFQPYIDRVWLKPFYRLQVINFSFEKINVLNSEKMLIFNLDPINVLFLKFEVSDIDPVNVFKYLTDIVIKDPTIGNC